MSRDVTKGGGTLAEAPRLSPELARILGKRKVVPNYGGDEGLGSGGAEFRDGVWDQPEWVDQRDRDEAAKALPGFEAMLRPLPQDRIREFLLFLWTATKHQGDMRWEGVETIYPMMLDGHPGWCFRPERLKLAAQHAFTWFPSVQELVAFMEPDRRTIIERVEALRKVSESPTQPPKTHRPGQKPWAEGGADDAQQAERERVDRERRELVEIMRQRDLAEGRVPLDTSVPERAPLEGDKEYVSRVMQTIHERIDAGARARRGDEERLKARREAQVTEKTREAQSAFRKVHEHGPPPPPKGSDPPDGERLSGMAPDFTSEDDP
jgi:hypothetical protein